MEYQGVSSFPKNFEFASLCSFTCVRIWESPDLGKPALSPDVIRARACFHQLSKFL